MDKLSTSTFRILLVISISFIVASVVNIYPMDISTAKLRPMSLIMVLIFWLIYQPKYVGVMTAFFIGLLADLLLDTLIGQQAFAAVLVALTINISRLYIKQLNVFIGWMLACIGLIVFQASLWFIQYIEQNVFMISSALSLFTSMFSWLFLYLILQTFTHR